MGRKRKSDPIAIGPQLVIEPELKAAEEIAIVDAIQASAEPKPGEPVPSVDSEPVPEGSQEAEAKAESAETPAAEEPEEFERAPQPPPKLERLQKILAQAGIASRRHAEELISGGHVEVNGRVVTTLGTKADAARDHIRVDGKLLKGAERLRYLMLNKPRGFVTTASDPEGRPTVMQFFSKMHERLYPVGRLDYLSEGLLLVTNDGELAHKLTRAASGVEKTYLVKVSGEPTEEELDILRGGVGIDRERPGTGKVHTAPARISQIRQGDNPWYEVVLIEGRNRELRKMFSEIGHFVEKIRRVGYGPLILDLEPGKVRELDQAELEALRKTADGKMKPRRFKTADMIPIEAGRPVAARSERRPNPELRPSSERHTSPDRRPAFGGKPPRREGTSLGRTPDRRDARSERHAGGENRGYRPAGRDRRDTGKGEWKPRGVEQPASRGEWKPKRADKPTFRPTGLSRPPANRTSGPPGAPSRDFRPRRAESGELNTPQPRRFDRPRSTGARPATGRPGGTRDMEPFQPRRESGKPFRKPGFAGPPRREGRPFNDADRPRKPFSGPGRPGPAFGPSGERPSRPASRTGSKPFAKPFGKPPGKSGSSSGFRPRPSGFAPTRDRGKPSGPKRPASGSRPSRPNGKSSGKGGRRG